MSFSFFDELFAGCFGLSVKGRPIAGRVDDASELTNLLQRKWADMPSLNFKCEVINKAQIRVRLALPDPVLRQTGDWVYTRKEVHDELPVMWERQRH